MAAGGSRAETARTLRDQARQVLAETGLFTLLQERFGQPTVTGSAGYDLMVRRQIDIDLALDAERAGEWMAFGGELLVHFGEIGLPLVRATYFNSYAEPHPRGGGLCWTLEFPDFADNRWTVEIWGWDPFDFAVRQARDFSLRTDLQASDRDLILRLKTEARDSPHYYGDIVCAFDIYQFAIAKGGTTLSALEAWKKKQ